MQIRVYVTVICPSIRLSVSHLRVKKQDSKLLSVTSPKILTDFRNSFTVRLRRKSVTKSYVVINTSPYPEREDRYTTLPAMACVLVLSTGMESAGAAYQLSIDICCMRPRLAAVRQWRREGVCRPGQTSCCRPRSAIDILMVTTMSLARTVTEQYAELVV